MDNKMQIEISIKDNLSRQLAQMAENVKKAANAMKQQVSAIQEAFNNIKIRTDMSKQVNSINKEIDNIGKKTKSVQINIKAKLDSSGLNGLNVQDKQVKISVDVDDDEIEKVFKNIDVEIEDIEDDFDSLDIKSNIVKQIKDIIKQLNSIGNKVKDVEIDIKADLDESELRADLNNFKGEVNVKANVNGLNNLNQDVDIDANVNTGGLDNVADMAQLGATSKLGASMNGVSASMNGVSASMKEVAETMKKMFDTGVKNSTEYQTTLERVRQAYIQMKDLQLEIGTGPDVQDDWAEEFINGETIQNITKTLESARKQFELFAQSMNIPQAKSCLQLIEELQEALFNIETKEIDTEFLDILMKKMNAVNEMSNIEVDIDADVKEAIDEAIKLGDLAKELSAKKYELRFNVNAEIDNLQDMIDDTLSGNPYADIDISEIGAAQEKLDQLRQRQAALNDEIQNLRSKIDIATNSFNNLDYVLKQTGNNTNGTKNAFTVLSSALASIKQKIAEIVPQASLLGTKFQSLKTHINDFTSKAAQQLDKFKKKIAEIIPDANTIGSGLDALQSRIEQNASIEMTPLGKIRSSKLLPETTQFNTTIQSLKAGISNFTGYTFTAFNNLKDRILQLTTIFGKIGTAFNGLKDKISGVTSKVGEQFTKLKNNISSSVTNATTKVFEKLKSALSGLSPTLSKIGTGFVNLGKKMAQTKVIANGLNKVFSLFKTTLGKLGLMFGVYELIQFGKQAIETAANIEEAQNVIDVTFQKQANTINKWAKENASAFGLTELQAKNFAGTFGTIFQASGVNMDYVDDMSIQLSQLAGDLASFRNLSVDDAFEKLRSGIVGSTEPLEYVAA